MAAKPTPKAVIDAILIDWRIGQSSQNEIAEKHRVSKGLVNKTCRGVEQDVKGIVTAGVAYREALSAQDDRIVTAVTAAVDEITRRLEFFRNVNMLVARTVATKVQSDGMNATYQELSAAATALSRAQDAVLGKSPQTVVNNLNQHDTTVVASPQQIREIHAMLEALV